MAHAPILTTAEAATYLRYRSASGIRTVVMRGELIPCGAGPKACHLFTIAELDRFVAARGARYAKAGRPTPSAKVPPVMRQ